MKPNILENTGILIYSGGLDSTTLLYQMKPALAVSFDYGSNHNERELECASRNCSITNTEHLVIPLHNVFNQCSLGELSSLISGAGDVPEGHYEDATMRSTVVPFRNGVMLSVAVAIAEARKLNHVYLASHKGDNAIYPDCRTEFTTAMSKAASLGTYGGVEVVSPFGGLTKNEIVSIGASLGVPFAETYSCYKGGVTHCGKCGTCTERRLAFSLAGIVDPTLYEDG